MYHNGFIVSPILKSCGNVAEFVSEAAGFLRLPAFATVTTFGAAAGLFLRLVFGATATTFVASSSDSVYSSSSSSSSEFSPISPSKASIAAFATALDSAVILRDFFEPLSAVVFFRCPFCLLPFATAKAAATSFYISAKDEPLGCSSCSSPMPLGTGTQ